MGKFRGANVVNGKMFAVDKKYLKVVGKKIGKSAEQTLHVLLNEHAQMSKQLIQQKEVDHDPSLSVGSGKETDYYG